MSFLIYENGITAEEAYKLVKKRLPNAKPNVGFIMNLKSYA
jgi:hypothetical protein